MIPLGLRISNYFPWWAGAGQLDILLKHFSNDQNGTHLLQNNLVSR